MHPFAKHSEHRAGKRRAHHILKGKKHGGATHSDEAEDRKLFKKMIAEHDHKAAGKKSGGRLNKYARGGAAKKHHTQVNIAVVAPHGRSPDGPTPPPGALPPPAGGPPGMPPGGMPGGMPPTGMPPQVPGMMKRGGVTRPAKMGRHKYTGGGDSGVGRKERAHAYGIKPKRGRD